MGARASAGAGPNEAERRLSEADITARLDRILIDEFEVEEHALRRDASLAGDLGLDSLDGVDLVVAIEKTFACRIAEDEARAIKTLGDIYDSVRRHLAPDAIAGAGSEAPAS